MKLNFDHTDIKKLRCILNVSATELALRIPICKSHMSDLENGKKKLSLDMYTRILDCLITDKRLLVSLPNIEFENERENSDMKNNVNLEVVERLENMIELKKEEYCIDGIFALKELLAIYKTGDNRLFIATNKYGIYDGIDPEGCANMMCSKTLILNRNVFEQSILKDNYIEELEECWSVPTEEGVYVDLHTLTSEVKFYNNTPVTEGMFYKVLVSKIYDPKENGVIECGEIGYNEGMEVVNGKEMLCLYFGKGNTSLSKREYFNFNEVEVVKQILSTGKRVALEGESAFVNSTVYI